ncbi:exo-alpha-sialidase [Sphingomonas sp. BK345]|uniref:sialidase family protein n=1 Tax=Sphingomonas sp. BK345 TaxID=2586980 RepID=UPI00161C15B2|nr:sialidase family protein [Sphingomonas sp. BK345]MBB3475637.1 putative neuraminidase [Sphingomonas sp. BK345]
MTSLRALALALVTPPTLAATSPSAIVASEFVDPAPPYPQAHASTIVQLADGALAAAWFGGSGEGHGDVRIWFARRTAAGWDTPRAVATGDGQPTWNPVLFQPRGAPLQLYYKVGPNPRDWWGMVIESRDGGRQWGAPRRLPAGVLGPIKNKPIVARDGAWLAPSSREVGSAAHNRWYALVERSTDRGRTWRALPAIASPRGLEAIQPSLLTLRDGRLLAVARTRQGVLAQSWSRDAGRHWSPLTALALPNPNAGTDAVTLADGRQLLVYNDSTNHPGSDTGPRWPLAVALSDDGVRWRRVLTLESEPRPDGYAYPAVIQARDGLVHVTYTWNRERIRHVAIDIRRLR